MKLVLLALLSGCLLLAACTTSSNTGLPNQDSNSPEPTNNQNSESPGDVEIETRNSDANENTNALPSIDATHKCALFISFECGGVELDSSSAKFILTPLSHDVLITKISIDDTPCTVSETFISKDTPGLVVAENCNIGDTDLDIHDVRLDYHGGEFIADRTIEFFQEGEFRPN